MSDHPDNLVLQILREIRSDIAAIKSDIVSMKSDIAALREDNEETHTRLTAIERVLQTAIRLGHQAAEDIVGARAELHGRIDRMARNLETLTGRVDRLETQGA